MKNIVGNIFHVGLPLVVEARHKANLKTQLLGWDRDSFLVAKAIYHEGYPAQLNKNDPCTIRFLKDGVAYGFKTEVIALQFYPFPLMFFRYPVDVERLALRGSHRRKVNLPATISDASGAVLSADAVILDISEGGCALKVPVKEGAALTQDAVAAISFRSIDHELDLECCCRTFEKKGKYAYFLGTSFTNVTAEQKEMLASLLDFLSRYQW